jgi:hypothetical protein
MRRIAVLFILAMSACSGGIDQAGDGVVGADATIADAHTMDGLDTQMIGEASRMRRFTRINRAPYASTLGAFNINLYVNQDAREFRTIHPESAGTQVHMPVGTLIVRQVLDANGDVAKVTLMAKGPPGYDPSIGDWWFGVTDASGVPLSDASGVQVGRLTACHGCHIPRATDDYLFGVPKIDQS